MECVMASQIESGSSFSSCFQYGGGGGGILNNVYHLYNDNPSTTWFTTYAENRPCGTDAVPPNGGPDNERYVYYDLGAYAIAFAISEANSSHASSGGRTFLDFWQSEGGSGFWHNIQPFATLDEVNGWASDVPDTDGWKAALLNFTGFVSYAEFCTALETHINESIVRNDRDASIGQLRRILESDTFVANHNQDPPSYGNAPIRNGCSSTAPSPSPAAPSPSPGEPSSNSDGGGDDDTVLFVGVAIGSVVASTIVIAVGWYCFMRSKK
eukprot:g1625.t1